MDEGFARRRLSGRRPSVGLLPHAWSVLLPLLLLGPALRPGYVLSYDMVWVPQLALRSDFWGGGGGLPRAVPSDAVVALLDDVVPGMLLQKLVLLGALVLVAQGALRLAGPSLAGRLTAVSVAVWNPFVVERLLIGHWPVLLGYAVVPWLVVLLRRAHDEGRLPVATWFLVPLGCLSASAGLVTAIALLVLGLRAGTRPGTRLQLVGLALAGNAPWVVAGLLHASSTSARVTAAVFAPHPEGTMPVPLAALGLGGIWNSEVVPVSRTGAMAWVALAGLLLLAVLGARPWWRRVGAPEGGRVVALWVAGMAVVLFTWAAPAWVDDLAGALPGAGLLRDGSRYLALCLPLLVATTSDGAEALVSRVGSGAPRWSATVACVLFPVMVMTDAAWGVGGRLEPVDFPPSWSAARATLAAAHERAGGDVLVLPFRSYRAPAWNHGRKVLDPLGRFLTPNYVVDDELSVSGRRVPGDDPRVPRILAGLDRLGPRAQARMLADEGIRYVVQDLEATASGEPRSVTAAGTTLFRDATLQVVEVAGPVRTRDHPTGWWMSLVLGWASYAALLVAGVLIGLVRRVRPWRDPGGPAARV